MADWSDAFALIRSTLESWGLSSLEGDVRAMLEGGDSETVVVMKLRDTKAYKERFAANEERRRKGLVPLSEGEYLATEQSYRQVMRQHGLPEGFYDSIDDFRQFIAADVSPQEMRDRVTLAAERYMNAPVETKDQFDRFGLSAGQALAAILDPDRALPLLRQSITAAELAGTASLAYGNRDRLSVDRANELAAQGVQAEDARKAFGELANREDRDRELAALAGYNLTQRELEDDALLGQRSRARERGLAQEQAGFRGSYVATETGLSRGERGRI